MTKKTVRKRTRRRITKSKSAAKKRHVKPPAVEQANTIAHVISKMRTDAVSLSAASREFGIDPRTILKRASSALLKLDTGRYIAKDNDRISRVLLIPTPEGLREITLANSRQASQLAKYWDAVQKYLGTGDASALTRFEGKDIKSAGRERIPLLTNLGELDRLGSAGVLSFESVYARTA